MTLMIIIIIKRFKKEIPFFSEMFLYFLFESLSIFPNFAYLKIVNYYLLYLIEEDAIN